MKFKLYFTIDCISFTVLLLLFSGLSAFELTTVTAEAVAMLFLMTTCVAVLMSFTDRIGTEGSAANMIVDLADVIGVVFVIGGITGFVPLEPVYVLIVLAMIVAVYFITFGVMMIKTKADAEHINQRIERLKEGEREKARR